MSQIEISHSFPWYRHSDFRHAFLAVVLPTVVAILAVAPKREDPSTDPVLAPPAPMLLLLNGPLQVRHLRQVELILLEDVLVN